MKKLSIPEFGIECSYAVSGSGPNVILIHGLCDSGQAWATHAALLSEKYTVLVPDLPGFGQSQPFADGNFALERMQQAVFAMADAEAMQHFSVVGHSMGGYTAMAMLEEQPQRVDSVCLFHSTSHGDTDEKKNGRDRTIRVLRKNRDLFFREVFKNLFNAERLSQFMPVVNDMYRASAGIETETVAGTLLALRDRKDRYEILKAYRGPVSYFIGRHDNVFDAQGLIGEAESLGVDYHVSEISGHMGFYEDPEVVGEYLFRFLGRTVH